MDIAAQDNPAIAIGRARRAGAAGARVRSRQGFSPRLTLEASHLRLDTSTLDNIPTFEPQRPPAIVRRDVGPLNGNVASLELVQPLINVGAWNARRQAGRALEAAELDLHRARREVDVAVVEAYFGARTARRQVEAERKGLATAQRALRQAEAGFEQELVAPVDVLVARTRVSEMEARVAAARASVIGADAVLRQVLGTDEDHELILTDPVPRPKSPAADTPDRRQVLSERRDLRALEQGLEAAEFGVKRARAAWLPDLNLYARYDRFDVNDPLNVNETGWLVALNLRWTPFLGFGQVGALDEAEALAAETRAKLRALRQQAWAEARTEFANWEAEVQAWRTASSGKLDAEEALALTEARYAEGLDDITALLRAQAEDLAARTREINARYNAVVAAARYRLAVSGDTLGLRP
nr:TolC family protein [Wenzhouxiangella sp. XN79A]